MSILVKGMQMPKNCAFCPVEHYDCPLLGEDEKGWGIDVTAYFDGNERHPDCPLVEVPPHGDLIDRDALMKDGWLALYKRVNYMGGYAIHELPLKNPTIPVVIEKEKEDG